MTPINARDSLVNSIHQRRQCQHVSLVDEKNPKQKSHAVPGRGMHVGHSDGASNVVVCVSSERVRQSNDVIQW